MRGGVKGNIVREEGRWRKPSRRWRGMAMQLTQMEGRGMNGTDRGEEMNQEERGKRREAGGNGTASGNSTRRAGGEIEA